MHLKAESRADLKRKALLLAATELFLDQGFDRTSMDDVAAKAAVSKPTVYKYFVDKEQLFAEIVRATTTQIDELVRLVVESMADPEMEAGLNALARQLVFAIMQPQVLCLRRLVIANADRFPNVGRSWYEQGFERVLTTLATKLQVLADRKLLRIDDAQLAANHFVGLLLWIPVNKAMFTGDHDVSRAKLEGCAIAAVRAFLGGYASTPTTEALRKESRKKIVR